jgi:hypothetical protein
MKRTGTADGPSPVTVGDVEPALDRLRRLLERQLELVHRGRLAAAQELFEQTAPCVQTIVDTQTLDSCGWEGRRENVRWLYRQLCLALTTQREETAAALNAVRRGKRLLKTYGNYLSAT